jgi:hypothetical protein
LQNLNPGHKRTTNDGLNFPLSFETMAPPG